MYMKPIPTSLSEDEYYHQMARFTHEMPFDEMYRKWYACFTYILKSYKLGYSQKIIDSLFHEFDMDNWHLVSEHEKESKEELLKHFCGDTAYISDRTSYDRLFRTHWYFIYVYHDELNMIKYPTVFTK